MANNHQVNVDLSKVETSMTTLLEQNRAKFDSCSSVAELKKVLESVFKDNNFDTTASKRLMLNVSKKRQFADALMVIYNSMLAGSKLAVDQK